MSKQHPDSSTPDPVIPDSPISGSPVRAPAWAEEQRAGNDPLPQESPEPITSETVVEAAPEVVLEKAAPTKTASEQGHEQGKAVRRKREAPALSPEERLKRRGWLSLALRIAGGLVTLGLLLTALQSGLEWTSLLFVWVLLTIIADEFGGWFGYAGALLGLLTLTAPGQNPDDWSILLPLVGGPLLGLLLVKHSGGWLVLPFAAAVFALPLLAASRFEDRLLDPNLLLVAAPDMQRSAVLAMLIGLGLSLVRQFVLWLVDLAGRRAERRVLNADRVPVKRERGRAAAK